MSMAVYCQLNQQTRPFSTVMASELVESVSKHQIRFGIGRWAGPGGVVRLNPCRETKIQGANREVWVLLGGRTRLWTGGCWLAHQLHQLKASIINLSIDVWPRETEWSVF